VKKATSVAAFFIAHAAQISGAPALTLPRPAALIANGLVGLMQNQK
jgi:hypothetical protein